MNRLWRHIARRRRIQLLFLFALLLMSAFAEVASLGAIVPFLGALVAPQRIFQFRLVQIIAPILHLQSTQSLTLALTIIFAATALVAGAIRMLQLWVSSRLTFSLGTDFSCEIYRRTLFQPYQVHAQRNTSEVTSTLTNKVDGVVFAVLITTLTMVSSLVLLLAIIVALFAIDFNVALISTLSFGFSYGIITLISKNRLRQNGNLIAREHSKFIKAIQEGLGGIRDVLLDGSQATYCEIYYRADQQLRRAQGNTVFISGCPRFITEATGMIIIAVLAYYLSQSGNGLTNSIPILGALALGAQRLLPTLQNIFSSWASIAATQSSLLNVVSMLEQPVSEIHRHVNTSAITLKNSIAFKNVSFRYSESTPLVLHDVSFAIKKGTRIGLVGPTGSGKSTITDILMGLLVPTDGLLEIDGQPITRENLRSWQKALAHVPQSIYLSDASLLENIAFGVPVNQIDLDRVQIAAKKARITDFVHDPSDFNRLVGERGVRLSGGQRQRIGIARALYKEANILIFDEATSALDNSTESSVMESIEALDRDLTVIIVAHRLTTIRECDMILELDQGRIVAQGTYDELCNNSASFKKMAFPHESTK